MGDDGQLIVHARFTAHPGRGEELVDAVLGMFPTVAEETGTLVYAAHRDRDDPDTVVMYEVYASDGSFGRHGESPAAGRLGERLDELLAEEPQVWFTRPLRSLGLDVLATPS